MERLRVSKGRKEASVIRMQSERQECGTIRNEIMQGLVSPGQELGLYFEHEGKPSQGVKPAPQAYMCPKST